MKTITVILAFFVAAVAPVALSAPTVTAEIQPQEIAVGESARLVIKVSVDGAERPDIPTVDGLRIDFAGQSSQIRIVNGEMSTNRQFNYLVSASKKGEFSIPPIEVRAAGAIASTEPVTLRVVASGKVVPPSLSSKKQPAGGSTATAAPGNVAFLRVERADNSGRAHLYVGEMTPIAIRAYFREGAQVTLNSKPSVVDNAFTLRGVSEEPEQKTTKIDGQRYRVLTWYAGLAGVKAGEFQVEATLDATVGIPQKRQRSRSARSPFGSAGSAFDDPFLDSMFDGFFSRVEQRDLTLTSPAFTVTLEPLPSKGRPPHFDGAVGQFNIGSFSIPAELQTGDPATLNVTVAGRGNFDRVTTPTLHPEDGWKIYNAKDSMEPGDAIGLEGRKTFEIPAIALNPEKCEVHFSLVYFDPEAGEYRTAKSESVPVTVTGTAIAAGAVANAADPTPAVIPSDALAPLRDSPGRTVASLKPVYFRPWFIATQGGISLVLAASLVMIVERRRRERHPERAAKRATAREIAELVREVDSARIRQDGGQFFTAARRALQLKLAERWGCHPEAITSEDVRHRLAIHCTSVARLFAMADEVEFSGARPDPDTYGNWQARLETALRELDEPSPSSPRHGTPAHWGEVPQTN